MTAFGDFLSRFWWVFAILLIILVIYIWSKLDSYTKRSIKKAMSGTTLMLVIFVGGWIIWHKVGSSMTFQTSDFWAPFIAVLYLLGVTYIGKLRYETNQFETPNFHGSFSKNPYKVGGFYIFAIDSFDAGGLSWPYAKRIAIVREETAELLREGAFSIAMMSYVSKYDLPEEVKQFIENNKFFKKASNKEVYYGWFDDIEQIDWEFEQLKKLDEEKKEKILYNLIKKELNVDNPRISTLLWLYKNQSKAVNKQTEYYDSTVESVEKGVEHHKAVKEAYGAKEEKPHKFEGSEENY